MKLISRKVCMCLFCALACILLMGICPGGASCSGPDNHINMGHATHDECCDSTHISSEDRFCFEHAATEHLAHECCQHCSDSHFYFGCGGELVLPNQTKSISFVAFACTSVITNNAGLVKDGLPSQLPDAANAALPFLRTVILLT